MAIIPIGRYGKEIRWRGKPLSLDNFPVIRAYLDECLARIPCSDPELKPTRDLPLMLDLVLALKCLHNDRIEEARAKYHIDPPELDPEILPLVTKEELITWTAWLRDNPSLRKPKLRRQKLLCLGVKSGQTRVLFEKVMPYLDQLLEHEKRVKQLGAKLEQSGELARLRDERERLKPAATGLKRLEREIRNQIENPTITTERVSWELIRDGDGITAQVNSYVENLSHKYRARRFDASRLKRVLNLSPVSCAIGRGEFDGYVAFFFARGGKVALECGWEGNAIYVFPEDRWIALSKLTKSELLETHGHELQRIVHDPEGRWFQRLRRSLGLPNQGRGSQVTVW